MAAAAVYQVLLDAGSLVACVRTAVAQLTMGAMLIPLTHVYMRRRFARCNMDTPVRVAADAAESSEQRAPPQPSRYTGSDGRPKATLEQAFRLGRVDGNMHQMPWQLSWQRNERTLTMTDDVQAHLVKVFTIDQGDRAGRALASKCAQHGGPLCWCRHRVLR